MISSLHQRWYITNQSKKAIIVAGRYIARLTERGSTVSAKSKALRLAGSNGYVMNLPQILDAGLTEGNEWFREFVVTANSSENVGVTRQGNEVMVLEHGDTWSPARIRKAYRDKLTDTLGGKLEQAEVQDLIDGRASNGKTVDVYSWSEFKNMERNIPDCYRIVYDFTDVRELPLRPQPIELLRHNMLFIGRAGGYVRANRFLDKVTEIYSRVRSYGNWHRFREMVPERQAEGHTLSRCTNPYDGITHCRGLNNYDMFAVAFLNNTNADKTT